MIVLTDVAIYITLTIARVIIVVLQKSTNDVLYVKVSKVYSTGDPERSVNCS